MDRYEIAWRIWCWQEGYGKAEDREGSENWMRESDDRLTKKDIEDRDALLSIADDILAGITNENTPDATPDGSPEQTAQRVHPEGPDRIG